MKTFKQFLEEANAPRPDAHKTISRNWERRYRGLNLHLTKKDRNTHVGDIWVPPQHRGKGIGGRIMKGLGKLADKTGQTMTLRQEPEKGREADLSRFYAGHGFAPASEGGKKYTHIRHPRG